MKIQIKRLSPHQNAKLLAVLMGICSLIYVIPLAIAVGYFNINWELQSDGSLIEHGPPAIVYLLLPLIYLLVTYVSVMVICYIFNALARRLGGIELEFSEVETAQ